MALDYQRYGRQIALPSVGAKGQTLLAEVHVAFESATDDPALTDRARQFHERAGGCTSCRASAAVMIEVPPARSPAARLGSAAAAAVEAARRVLGEPARTVPTELLASLEQGP